MNFFNGGPENLFFRKMTSMDALAGTIRGVMMQKWETVKCIDREIGQLVEKRNGIGVELFRLSMVAAPCNHNRLPNEVLGRIFILVAQDYGPVHFLIPKSVNPPPQIDISHVCSHG